MTVAAVILSATADGALAETGGQPRVRRLVDIAWAGGALPVVVVSPDPHGAVAASLASTEAIHSTPAPVTAGPVGQMIRGCEVAAAEVHETTAALLWPARMTWVGAETVTSLIEAHGTDRTTVLRAAWRDEPGWPLLVPFDRLDALRSLSPELMPDDVASALTGAVASRAIELGDPGVVFDVSTARDELPAYEGPDLPAGGHVHEWGVEAPDLSEDLPVRR
ncbi:MAG: NTP transferase domain-containing protein [Chloroflexota bacterium]